MIRDLWPGVTPKRINTEFTYAQAMVLLDAEQGWAAKKKESGELTPEDEFWAFVGTGN